MFLFLPAQLVLVPDYCDPADLKEQFRKEIGARRKAAQSSSPVNAVSVGTLDDEFYSTPYETQRISKESKVKAAPASPSVASSSPAASSKSQAEVQRFSSKATPQPPPHASSSASSVSSAPHAEPSSSNSSGNRVSRQSDESGEPLAAEQKIDLF